MSFEVKLALFEGPFDLLLFFIERDELDIYDIPISKITAEFLDYLKSLDHLNMEVASDFILVAATLMNIKSRILLPRPEVDEKGNEIDPRDELVQKLLEYKKYKSIVQEFVALEDIRLQQEKRGNLIYELKKIYASENVEDELQDLDLYRLLKVFQKLSKRYDSEQSKPIHTVVQYNYTVDGQKENIILRLSNQKKLSFSEFFEEYTERIAIIFNFLAILEMLQMQLINVYMGEGYNNFWIELKKGHKLVQN